MCFRSSQAAAHARETFERVLLRLKGDTATTLPGKGQQVNGVSGKIDCGDGTVAPFATVIGVQLVEYEVNAKQLEWVANVSMG